MEKEPYTNFSGVFTKLFSYQILNLHKQRLTTNVKIISPLLSLQIFVNVMEKEHLKKLYGF